MGAEVFAHVYEHGRSAYGGGRDPFTFLTLLGLEEDDQFTLIQFKEKIRRT